jgi:16S rRNA (cytidine1402-2'-O)-methyltransferase
MCSASNFAAMPLVFVPTPLGNLRDVTLRALDILSTARLVVAEDTRVARRLFAGLKIAPPEIWSYREANADRITAAILERAREELVAVTSDAGMPGISDPGSALVAQARRCGVAVEVLPGPSAALGVALLSGFPLHRFVFEGFAPRTPGARRERFAAALRSQATTIWYESPQRVLRCLADLAAVAPDAEVFLVREYTKLYEEQLWGTPDAVAARLSQPVRGEIAFVVAPRTLPEVSSTVAQVAAAIDELLAGGARATEIARILAARGYGDRRELYATVTARKAAASEAIKGR